MAKSQRKRSSAIRSFTGSLPLQVKLILSFVLIIFIPILIYSWFLFRGVSDNAIRDLVKKTENILDIEKINIQNNVELMEWTGQLALSNQDMKDYLQIREETDIAWLLDFKTKTFAGYQHFLFNNPRIASIRLFTDNPHVSEFWPVVLKESRIRDRSWYGTVLRQRGIVWWEIQRGGEILSTAAPDASAATPYVSLLREFMYPDDSTHNGILEVSMEVRHFFTKTFSSVQEPGSQLLVVARGGEVYTDEKAAVFRNAPARELVKRLALTDGEGNASETFDYEGHPYLAVHSYIPRLDVHLVNVVTLADTLADIRQTRSNMTVIILVLVGVLCIVSYFMHSLILKRLRVLRDSMKKVRGGNFSPDVPVYGTDEVGELGHHYRQMLKKINELIAEQVNRQAATKEAELRSLKNQIDSHFLYNTLENLKMLAEVEGQYTISDALTSLGGMMRYSLQWTRDRVRLRDEIQHIQHYMAIMNVRYDGKLELRLDVPPELNDQEVLKMSLQPIVENAVKHGMSQGGLQGKKLSVSLSAAVREGECVVEIADNGCGIPEDRLRRLNSMLRMEESDYRELRGRLEREGRDGGGIGLRNVDHRLVMSYGIEYGIRIESVEGSFTRVVMTLPHFMVSGGEGR
ncbi:histidine kinase [Cohnella algarum]|uniref:histidine kinase n=1 Tax=Cohnella algarum TaxID=2044859 RepID=UPI0019674291|nr:sensor histidine kinase [Cohnella algarum]